MAYIFKYEQIKYVTLIVNLSEIYNLWRQTNIKLSLLASMSRSLTNSELRRRKSIKFTDCIIIGFEGIVTN